MPGREVGDRLAREQDRLTGELPHPIEVGLAQLVSRARGNVSGISHWQRESIPRSPLIQDGDGERSKLGRGGRRAEIPSGRTDVPPRSKNSGPGLLNHTRQRMGVETQNCGRSRGRAGASSASSVWGLASAASRRRSGRRQSGVEGDRLRAGARRRAAGARRASTRTATRSSRAAATSFTPSSRSCAAIRWSSTSGPRGAGRAGSSSPTSRRSPPSAATRSPSSASTPTTRPTPPTTSSTSSRCPIRASATPTREVRDELELRGLPGTAFYDADGELVYLKQGPYLSEDDLERRHRQVRSASRRPSDNPRMRLARLAISAGSSRSPGCACCSPGAGRRRRTSTTVPSIELDGDDRPGDREVDRLGARRGRRRRRAAGDHPHRHAGRARELDARDRPGHPRGADAGRRLRLARTAPAPPRPAPSSPRPPTSPRWRRRPTSARRARSPSTGEDIGGTLGVKIENDAAAFIRALAESHGRDGELPERMVTEADELHRRRRRSTRARSTSSPPSEDDLLAQLDGFQVQGPKAQTLDDRGADDRASATRRSSTSCCSCSSTRRSPTCCCSSAWSGSRSRSSAPG